MAFLPPSQKRYASALTKSNPPIQKRETTFRLGVALAVACDRGKTRSKLALAAVVRKLPLVDRTAIAGAAAFWGEKEKAFKACDFEFNMAMGAKAEKDGSPGLAWWFYGAAPDTGNKLAYERRNARTKEAQRNLSLYYDGEAALSGLIKTLSPKPEKSSKGVVPFSIN